MFITPLVVKAERESSVVTIAEEPIVNLKAYRTSNVQRFGDWRSTTQSVHEEMLGPAAESQSKDVAKTEEDTEGDE